MDEDDRERRRKALLAILLLKSEDKKADPYGLRAAVQPHRRGRPRGGLKAAEALAAAIADGTIRVH